jgi:hypothetical protein
LKKLEKEVKKEEEQIPWYQNLSIPPRRVLDDCMPSLFDDEIVWSHPSDFGISEELGLMGDLGLMFEKMDRD